MLSFDIVALQPPNFALPASRWMDNAAYTTSGQLAELVDKKVLIVLRDNRKLIGVLRSYDQYGALDLLLCLVSG